MRAGERARKSMFPTPDFLEHGHPGRRLLHKEDEDIAFRTRVRQVGLRTRHDDMADPSARRLHVFTQSKRRVGMDDGREPVAVDLHLGCAAKPEGTLTAAALIQRAIVDAVAVTQFARRQLIDEMQTSLRIVGDVRIDSGERAGDVVVRSARIRFGNVQGWPGTPDERPIARRRNSGDELLVARRHGQVVDLACLPPDTVSGRGWICGCCRQRRDHRWWAKQTADDGVYCRLVVLPACCRSVGGCRHRAWEWQTCAWCRGCRRAGYQRQPAHPGR